MCSSKELMVAVVMLSLSFVGFGCSGVLGGGDDEGEPAENDSGGSMLEKPNQCAESSTAREYIGNNQLGGVSIPAPNWKLLEGAEPEEETFSATWEGAVQLDETVDLDCPPYAEQAGLVCETDTAFEVTRSAKDGTVTNRFVMSVPLSKLALPDAGADVEVTYPIERDLSGPEVDLPPYEFSIASEASGEVVFSIVKASGEFTSESFEYMSGGISVTMPNAYRDPSSAHCVVEGPCPRVYRFEPLTVGADQMSETVPPGSNATFSLNQRQYKFWHLVSHRRGGGMTGWTEVTCADGWWPAASFAFGRT